MEVEMLFSRLAKSAFVLLLLTIGLAGPVHAQNNEQIISGNWYEDRALSANSSTEIILTFAQTPTNQFLNVTNVACTVDVSPNQAISVMSLVAGTTTGADDLHREYAIKGNATPEIAGAYKWYSIVTNQIFYKFGPGRFPSILINSVVSTGSASLQASCVIVGNLTDN
jgi:hypothetical protein